MSSELLSIFKGCKKGRKSDQRKLFLRYYPILLAIAERYCSVADDAQDVLQESFLNIYDSVGKIKWNSEASFVVWMKRVVVNNSINHYKRKQRLNEVELLEKEADVAEEEEIEVDIANLADDEITSELLDFNDIADEQLLEFLSKVSEKNRIVFNLFVIEGRNHKEISEILGIPERTSASRLIRARMVLKREIIKFYRSSTSNVV